MLIKIKEEKKRGLPPLTAHQEAVMDVRMDKHFRNTQKELQKGRHFRFDTMRFIQKSEAQAFRENMDKIRWDGGKPPAYGI